MPIPTSRTNSNAAIYIDKDLCTGCGLCVTICSDNSIVLKNNKAEPGGEAYFGCIGCGHCMAICPENAIKITGRAISQDDLFDLSANNNNASFELFFQLMLSRRSIRHFSDKNVAPELIIKILEAAQTAPMGLPPSDVHVVVWNGREKTSAFARDFCFYLDEMKWFVSDWFLTIMKPFWGKNNDSMFRGFIQPLFKLYTAKMKKGINMVNYDAPLLMYFHGSPFTDPADPIVAATYAMMAGHSLGLGTIMLGAVHPLIQNGKRARRFRAKHHIKYSSREGIFVAFGYPVYAFKKGIRRSFAEITYN